jgi:hypothetical protein
MNTGKLEKEESTCLERKKGHRHRSVQDSRKFYKRLNDTRKLFELAVAMCRATNGQLLINKDQMLSKWKEFFEQRLNESYKVEPHANQESSRENDVTINLS